MNTLIINAGPRRNGNCAFLASKLQEKYNNDCKLINLIDLNITPCVACRSCKVNDTLCVINDDMTSIYDDIFKAEKLIFISPNYFGFVSSLGKIFTDRWYCLKDINRVSKIKEEKKALFFLLQGAPSRDHGKNITEWAKHFFTGYGFKYFSMTIAGCDYDNTNAVENKLDEILMNTSMF